MQKGPGETSREQPSRLQDVCTTMEGLQDVIIKEQLVDTLPQALKIRVSKREPSSSKEAGELADSFLQARGLEQGARQGEYKHMGREHQYPSEERVANRAVLRSGFVEGNKVQGIACTEYRLFQDNDMK